MTTKRYDVVLLGDFRFPGGTSSAVAEEIKAGAGAGYRIGLVHLEAPILVYPHPVNPRIRELIDKGMAELAEPGSIIDAGLAVIHSPHVVQHVALNRPRLRAERRLLAVHHPPRASDGTPNYDVHTVRTRADDLLDGTVAWAPVGPAVRAQLAQMIEPPPLADHDWYNIIDVAGWAVPRDGFQCERPVIGRHSRPDPLKWPDDRDRIIAAYPDDPRFFVRILGGGPFLSQLVGLYPRNWEVWPFGAMAPAQFLQSIDFFVYFHHSTWVEAFGCTIAEAMASGAVVVLPAHFKALFKDAALYAEPHEVASLVLDYHGDREAYRRQAGHGRELVEAKFSPAAHVQRLQQLIGPPRAQQIAVPALSPNRGDRRRAQQRVLFVSSNGVGMGHLARLLAIARRCPTTLTPVFATMSQALSTVGDCGFLAEYLPFHVYVGCDIEDWNRHLRQELNELIAFYEVPVVLCDVNVPYQGLLEAISDNPQTWFVWCRRGMWRAGVGAKFIEREHHFHAVLEPRDLAGDFDAGLTARSRGRARIVPPIRLLDSQELLPRAVARRELGLDLERPAVIVLLGSGNNFDYGPVRQLVLDHLAGSADVQLVVAEWLVSNESLELPPGVRRLRRFPLARWFGAFDAAVSAVGYNSYHELIFAGVPTLFVPNENPQQDDQLTRARYAERHGLGFCVRAGDVYRLKPTLDRLMDPDDQAAIRARCSALDGANGAADAARMIEEYAHICRADRVRRL